MTTLFHGSYTVVSSPLVKLGRTKVDFGQGFYRFINHRQGGINNMRDNVLWRKQSRIIMLLAESLHISAERALDLFYSTQVYKQLMNPRTGLQLMSDLYILEDLIRELRE